MTFLRRLRSTAYQRLHNMSLTRRLVAVVVLMVMAAYLLTISVTMTMLRSYLVDRADDDLQAYLEPLAASTVTQLLGRSGQEQPVFIPPNNYYIVFLPAYDTLPARDLVLPYQQITQSRPDVDREAVDAQPLREPFTVDAEQGDGQWRVAALRFYDSQGREAGTIVVGLPLSGVDETVRQLGLIMAAIGVATLVMVGVLGWFAVRRAFRPLTRIEDTAAAIAAGDLSRRVPPRDAHDEVGSLSESINRMLAQIEHSFAVREASEQRMRDFVADASHELRTPLATVRGYAELYRVGAVAPDDVGGAMKRIEDEASRMTGLVEDLLTLTRLDSEPAMSPTRVDLTVLASDVVQDARVRAPDRQVSLRAVEGGRGDRLPVVVGEDGGLRQVLTNLVANALTHTPAGTPVEVAVGTLDDQVVVEVRDHGPGLDPEAAERVFERFYRADRSRSRQSGGTGLGLPIAAAIVARHGGTVRHVPTPGGGATFQVRLPAAPPRTETEPEVDDAEDAEDAEEQGTDRR
ncbi:HAMP domain-containing sensor histidine kinase [Ornithinimicrobium humiphilum]|uniref:histidine kinase n=1 Tax=Ornithinimicrobium humiphilum TaxID=125288 RepID=A0A543KRM6_9MICO|nr:HAMP domain-containing sensor histidine kinase [Ornithinimicrobium humiphilum]TQM97724.1 two-component system OmpR family sensor kinase [Ornithinimicrobium humiphilum]